MKISSIQAFEILDSRGIPTVGCSLMLDGGVLVQASVPSGTSRGEHEALELRDADNHVTQAVANVNDEIASLLVGQTPDYEVLDNKIIELDGSENKSRLGANATLCASIAVAKAQAVVQKVELFSLFGTSEPAIPRVMFNLINGGAHAQNNLAIQEFMVQPVHDVPFSQVLQDVHTIFKKLGELLGAGTEIGVEGGYAPSLASEHEALEYLLRAIEQSGFTHDQYALCIDAAATGFYTTSYAINNCNYSSDELVEYYAQLCAQYPIISIEDGLSQDDEYGWQKLTAKLGSSVQIVGDDLFVTNEKRIQKGLSAGLANACVIKPNQVGTVTEALAALKLCQSNDMGTIVSHRSGETSDTFIADFAVGTAAGQFKCGAPVQEERMVKYERLLAIEKLI